MSAEIAILTQIKNGMESGVSTIPMEAAATIPKYGKAYLGSDGKFRPSKDAFSPSILNNIHYGTRPELDYRSTGTTTWLVPRRNNVIHLGNNHFFTVISYLSSANTYVTQAIVYRLDMVNNLIVIVQRSSSIVNSTNMTPYQFNTRNWSWIKVGNNFCITTMENVNSSYTNRLITLSYNPTTHALAQRAVCTMSSSSSASGYLFNISDTIFGLAYYDGSSTSYLVTKDITVDSHLTSPSSGFNSYSSSSYPFVSSIYNDMQSYEFFYYSGALYCIYSSTIKWTAITAAGAVNTATGYQTLNAPSVPSGYPAYNSSSYVLALSSPKVAGDGSHYFNLSVINTQGRVSSFKTSLLANGGATSIKLVETKEVSPLLTTASGDLSYTGFLSGGAKIAENVYRYFVRTTQYDTLTSTPASFFKGLTFTVSQEDSGVCNITDLAVVDNSFLLSNSATANGVYDSSSGKTYFINLMAANPADGDAIADNAAVYIFDGTAIGESLVSYDTDSYALEEIPIGTTGSGICFGNVVEDLTSVAGASYYDRLVATTTKKLLEVK